MSCHLIGGRRYSNLALSFPFLERNEAERRDSLWLPRAAVWCRFVDCGWLPAVADSPVPFWSWGLCHRLQWRNAPERQPPKQQANKEEKHEIFDCQHTSGWFVTSQNADNGVLSELLIGRHHQFQRVIQGDVVALQFGNQSFDLVDGFLEHFLVLGHLQLGTSKPRDKVDSLITFLHLSTDATW